jgi:predicted ATPase
LDRTAAARCSRAFPLVGWAQQVALRFELSNRENKFCRRLQGLDLEIGFAGGEI